MLPMFKELIIYPDQVIRVKFGDKHVNILVKRVNRWKIRGVEVSVSQGFPADNQNVPIEYDGSNVLSIKKTDGVFRLVRLGMEPSYIRVSPLINSTRIAKIVNYGAGDVNRGFGYFWSGETPRSEPKAVVIIPPGYYWTFDLQSPIDTNMYVDLEVIDLTYEEVGDDVEPNMVIQMAPEFVQPVDDTVTWMEG